MRLWVDDLRTPPDDGEMWTWALSSKEAIQQLALFRNEVIEISFDHDLGGDDTTRRVVLWICETDYPWPPVVRVHTANPVGREWLVGMINRYGPGVTQG